VLLYAFGQQRRGEGAAARMDEEEQDGGILIMQSIEPCPFCGKSRARVKNSQRWGYFVSCNLCAAVGPSSRTNDGAIEKWNRRISPAQGKLEI
jgi:Lar family restriction alleviation protein